MTIRILTYKQERPSDWLRDHPEETWRCDLYPEGGADHHGVGVTEAEAILNAAAHYDLWTRKRASLQAAATEAEGRGDE